VIPWKCFSIKKVTIFGRLGGPPGGGYPAGTTGGRWDAANLSQPVNYNRCRIGAFVTKGNMNTTTEWTDIFKVGWPAGADYNMFNATSYQIDRDQRQLFDYTFRLPFYWRASFGETATTTNAGYMYHEGMPPAGGFLTTVGGPLPVPEATLWATPFPFCKTDTSALTSTTTVGKNEIFCVLDKDNPSVYSRTFKFDAADTWSFDPITLLPNGGHVATYARMEWPVGPQYYAGEVMGGYFMWRIEVEYEERKF